jgi:hypothetical protein
MFVFLKQKLTSEITIIFFLILLLLPLAYIEVKNTHDWGDDFAAYIGQANAIVRGDRFFDTGFIVNAEKPDIPYVSVGWTLMILPVMAIFGDSIFILSMYMSIFLIGIGLLLYKLGRFYFTPYTSFILSLLFVYNPLILSFKQEVLSDIPFMFFFLLFLFLLHQIKKLSIVNIPLLMIVFFITFITRPMAIVLLPVFVFAYFNDIKKVLLSLMLFAGLFWVLKLTLLSETQNNILFYMHHFGFENVGNMLHSQLSHIIAFFNGGIELNSWRLISGAIPLILLVSFFRKSLWQNKVWLSCIFYFLLILIWTDDKQGFRYILSILPLIVFIIVDFLNEISSHFKLKTHWVASLLTFQMIIFTPGVFHHITNTKYNDWGINNIGARELFQFVNQNKNETFVFAKPRVLCMHSKIRVMYPIVFYDNINKNFDAHFNHKASVFISSKKQDSETYHPAYEYLISFHSKKLTKVWENKDFIAYKINN